MTDGSETPAVKKDDAYWDEVERAVGRGTPSSLLGTSTRALKRSMRELRESQEAADD